MQTRSGGDEIKERQEEEGKKTSEGRLKYLWCHLCWCMTPPLCNNMNETAWAASCPKISPVLYIAAWFHFSQRFGFIKGSVLVRRKRQSVDLDLEKADFEENLIVL